jgi:uncharacterized protein YsxB (DUF464 family)
LIEIKRTENCVSIKGHAGYAPHGQDIVCAAVSALVQTFIVSVDELTSDRIKVTHNEQGQIQTIQYRNLSKDAQLLVDSFFIGIRMIADAYPNHLTLSEHL